MGGKMNANNYPYCQADNTPKIDAEANESGARAAEIKVVSKKTFREYVTCDVCGNRYAGIVPKDGDGSALAPYRHYRPANLLRFGKKQVCPGSYKLAREFIK